MHFKYTWNSCKQIPLGPEKRDVCLWEVKGSVTTILLCHKLHNKFPSVTSPSKHCTKQFLCLRLIAELDSNFLCTAKKLQGLFHQATPNATCFIMVQQNCDTSCKKNWLMNQAYIVFIWLQKCSLVQVQLYVVNSLLLFCTWKFSWSTAAWGYCLSFYLNILCRIFFQEFQEKCHRYKDVEHGSHEETWRDRSIHQASTFPTKHRPWQNW